MDHKAQDVQNMSAPPPDYPTHPPQGYPTQPMQGYPTQPPQGYPTQPAQSYSSGPPMQQPMHPGPDQRTAAQVGEEYRAALFAQCAQGVHQPSTSYGVFGIIMAVVCFPCGLICLFMDTEQKCGRCGTRLDK